MRVLLTGVNGYLGAYLATYLETLPFESILWGGRTSETIAGRQTTALDLSDRDALRQAFAAAKPDLVIHMAAISAVGDCYRQPELAQRVNIEATEMLARLCADAGSRLVFSSTDMVFDGKRAPYEEEDTPKPLSIYGRTKAEAEEVVLAIPHSAVARMALLYGPTLLPHKPRFFDKQWQALREGQALDCFSDEWRTPSYVGSAAERLWQLAKSSQTGIWHLGGPERLSRLEMGRRMASALGIEDSMIRSISQSSIATPEPRPADTSMNSSKFAEQFPGKDEVLFAEKMQELTTRQTGREISEGESKVADKPW